MGPSGKLLRRAIAEAGMDVKEVYMTNVVRCGAQGSGNPGLIDIRRCRGYLIDELMELDYTRCRGVVLLGETALRGFLNDGRLKIRQARLRELDEHGPEKPSVEAVKTSTERSDEEGNRGIAGRGRSRPTEALAARTDDSGITPEKLVPVPLRATYHPAAALPHRNPLLYQEIVNDLKEVFRARSPVRPVFKVQSVEEVEAAFRGSGTVGLDLEWHADGRIRVVGMSDGITNVTVENPDMAIRWLDR